MIHIGLETTYDVTDDLVKAVLYKARIEKLNQIDIASYKHSSRITFDSNQTDVETVMSIINLGLKTNRINHENLWRDKTAKDSIYSCDIHSFNEGKIVASLYLRDSDEGRVEVELYLVSNSQTLLTKADEIKNALKALVAKKDSSIIKTHAYWRSSFGASSNLTNLFCPNWNQVKINYMDKTRDSIGELVEYLNKGRPVGKLILWYGEPGTGKTWAIRSLFRELLDEYVPVIITDTDVFCDDISYYYDIVQEHSKPCLFVMEDSAESILTETRAVYGNRISKLLNLTDGLMAQGRNDLFLISFNENITSIDPAFTRHGRCLNITKFTPFDRSNAIEWLKENNIDSHEQIKSTMTLAELYGILNQSFLVSKQDIDVKRIGFV